MPGANEPFGLIYYQIHLTPQPNNTYADNEFNAQLNRPITINLPGNKIAVGTLLSVAVAADGSYADFIVVVASLNTQGPRSDITQIPAPF